MRRLITGVVVAVTTVLVPLWAMAGNQEFAEQVAKNLRASGALYDYKIGVMYQDGTAWLRGTVCSEEQARTAMDLVSKMPGVTRVENRLTVAPPTPTVASQPPQTSTLQFARTQDNLATPQGSLRPAGGAFAAEQSPRVGRSTVGGVSSIADRAWQSVAMKRLQQAPEEPQPEPKTAQAVASSYVAAPAQPVSAQTAPAGESARPRPASQAAAPSNKWVRPVPVAYTQAPAAPAAPEAQPTPIPAPAPMAAAPVGGAPIPAYVAGTGGGIAPARYDQPCMPCYSWPSYASYPNFAAVTYPRQYSPTAWPYIGPFYPYPQVPLGWRKVTLEWHDGWWNLDFDDGSAKGWFSGLFRPCSK